MSKFTPPSFTRAQVLPGAPLYYCSFKGTHPGWKGLVNRGIRGLDKAIYSHTEIAVGHPFEAEALCVSSVGVDGGVRLKTMRLSPLEWDILPMPWVHAGVVYAFLLEHEGAGYDYIGTGRYALPFLLREHPKRWFCTEVAMAIAGAKEPWRYTPQTGHVTIAAMLERVTATDPQLGMK